VALRIAVVEGDDLSGRADALRAAGTREMFSGAPMPAQLLSLNVYLGAQPIAAALDAGADIVITGRVVDSAVTLGPLVHEFGWGWQDWDRLSIGSLAGHLIECGVQGTGGLFTDWERVPGWEDMGFPIVECEPDGRSFVLTKPAGTGGLIEPASVAEQLVYEIGDPRAYLLPDVSCDFSEVTLVQDGPDRVRVAGARGAPAPSTLKASATYADGWRLMGTLMIGGPAAARKAQRVGEAILSRCRRLILARGLGDFDETSLEVLGAESTYGPHARTTESREVILKLAARHANRVALDLLAREIAPSATSMAQGITGFAGGRPSPSPVVRLFSLRIDRAEVDVRISLDGEALPFEAARSTQPQVDAQSSRQPAATPTESSGSAASAQPMGATQTVPLMRIAYARSGDKGDMSNIGVIARSPAAYAVMARVLDAETVATYFLHLCRGKVTRYALPGCHAFNFTLEAALGGGGVASLRYDPQGKAFAQMLLDLPVEVPLDVLQELP
jgi:hypothetical protein